MNGPINNAKEKSLLSRQDWYQRLVEVGGVVVFIGLLIEDGPELWEALSQHRLPSRSVIGGIIVAIGVGVEVLFASLVTHASKRLQDFSDSRNAEFHERAANAEERTVELGAEVERLRKENNDISMVLADRTIKDIPGFVEAMKPFAGVKVLTTASESIEARKLQWWIKNGLESAGWLVSGPERRNAVPDCVTISLRAGGWHADASHRMAAMALGDWLSDSGVVPLMAFDLTSIDPGTIVINVGEKPQTVKAFNELQAGWAINMKELRGGQ
jgi:hypothetical protein